MILLLWQLFNVTLQSRDCSGSAAADKPAFKILISRAVIMTLQPRLNQLKKLCVLGELTGL